MSTLSDFRIVGADLSNLQRNPYRAAADFIRGRFTVEGDLTAAVRACLQRDHHALRSWIGGLLVRWSESPPIVWLLQHGSRETTAHDVRFHYDRSNGFYKQFLDPRMVYSCAYFENPHQSLEDAQLAKLDRICRKLDLHPGETLLDIGCGWGSLLFHACERYGVHGTGCTLSEQQWQYAVTAAHERELNRSVQVLELDYRDVQGAYDKIASIGMFEHVGRPGLPEYFSKAHHLLRRDGLFLNHGIVHRSGSGYDEQSLFVQRHVFPGTAMVTLPELIDAAERAGFEVLEVENIRPHYALTCRAWMERLHRNEKACLEQVDEETYRTWLLYLAGSAINFDEGYLDVHQILFARRDSQARPLIRHYK